MMPHSEPSIGPRSRVELALMQCGLVVFFLGFMVYGQKVARIPAGEMPASASLCCQLPNLPSSILRPSASQLCALAL